MLDEMSHEKETRQITRVDTVLTGMPKTHKPHWGQLYGLGIFSLLGLVGAAWVQAHSPHDAKWVTLLVMVIFYRALAEWIKWNDRYL